MRPNLIPYSFITKNLRKQYHRKRTTRTWQQLLDDYHSVMLFALGIAFVLLILYLKYQDKMRQVRIDQHTTQYTQHLDNLVHINVNGQPTVSYGV
jgi:hypothetical protein